MAHSRPRRAIADHRTSAPPCRHAPPCPAPPLPASSRLTPPLPAPPRPPFRKRRTPAAAAVTAWVLGEAARTHHGSRPLGQDPLRLQSHRAGAGGAVHGALHPHRHPHRRGAPPRRGPAARHLRRLRHRVHGAGAGLRHRRQGAQEDRPVVHVGGRGTVPGGGRPPHRLLLPHARHEGGPAHGGAGLRRHRHHHWRRLHRGHHLLLQGRARVRAALNISLLTSTAGLFDLSVFQERLEP